LIHAHLRPRLAAPALLGAALAALPGSSEGRWSAARRAPPVPKLVKEVDSSVTGRSPQNGFWDSDHAGLFSALKIY